MTASRSIQGIDPTPFDRAHMEMKSMRFILRLRKNQCELQSKAPRCFNLVRPPLHGDLSRSSFSSSGDQFALFWDDDLCERRWEPDVPVAPDSSNSKSNGPSSSEDSFSPSSRPSSPSPSRYQSLLSNILPYLTKSPPHLNPHLPFVHILLTNLSHTPSFPPKASITLALFNHRPRYAITLRVLAQAVRVVRGEDLEHSKTQGEGDLPSGHEP